MKAAPARLSVGSVTKVVVAVGIFIVVALAAAYCWASLVVTVFVDSSSAIEALTFAILAIGLPTVGCAYVVTRMAARKDLGVAYRAAWLCLPVAALGVWAVLWMLASQPIL